MNAIRKIIRRQGNTITIELPDDFQAETIEMILLPVDNQEAKVLIEPNDSLTELQRLLLKAPPMSDEEFSAIEERQNALNQWQNKSA